MESPLVVTSRVRIRADRRDHAVEAAAEVVRASREEPGCEEFRVAQDLVDPDTLCFLEVWENVESLTRHFQTSHVAAFNEKMRTIAVGDPEVKRYRVAA